jgi:hypothetical protein
MEGGGRRLASEVEKALLRRRFGNARDARRIGFYDSGRRRPGDVARPGRERFRPGVRGPGLSIRSLMIDDGALNHLPSLAFAPEQSCPYVSA